MYLATMSDQPNYQITNLNCKYQAKIILQISIPDLRSGIGCDLLRIYAKNPAFKNLCLFANIAAIQNIN